MLSRHTFKLHENGKYPFEYACPACQLGCKVDLLYREQDREFVRMLFVECPHCKRGALILARRLQAIVAVEMAGIATAVRGMKMERTPIPGPLPDNG